MSNTAIDLFQTFPNLQVTQADLLQAETFVTQTLSSQANYLSQPLDLRPGTALYDLVIRPNAVLFSLVRQGLLYVSSQNSLSNATDQTDTTVIDSILSNWFTTRNLGTYAVISARLYFAISKNVTIPVTTSFSPDGQNYYFPSSTIVVPSTSLTFDPSSGEYYLDVSLTAQNPGTAANISGGGLIYFTNFDPYFLRATINYLASTATNPETNTEYIARTSAGISTRNLINTPSILYNVQTNFPSLSGITSFGMGDVQMIRDQVQVYVPGIATPIWIHSGGYVDIYFRDVTASSVVQFTLDSTGSVVITGPQLTITRSSVSGGSAADTVPANTTFTLTNPNTYTQTLSSLTSSGTVATATLNNHGFAVGRFVTIAGATPAGYNGSFKVESTTQNTFTYNVPSGLTTPATGTITATSVIPAQDWMFTNNQTVKLSFGATYANGTASMVLNEYQSVPSVQSYLVNPQNRVICANYLARAFNVYQLSLVVNSYSGVIPPQATVMTTATNYVNSLAPGAPFVISDLVTLLTEAGITSIQTPIGVTYTMYNTDVAPSALTGTIVDALEPPDLTYVFTISSVTTGVVQLAN